MTFKDKRGAGACSRSSFPYPSPLFSFKNIENTRLRLKNRAIVPFWNTTCCIPKWDNCAVFQPKSRVLDIFERKKGGGVGKRRTATSASPPFIFEGHPSELCREG